MIRNLHSGCFKSKGILELEDTRTHARMHEYTQKHTLTHAKANTKYGVSDLQTFMLATRIVETVVIHSLTHTESNGHHVRRFGPSAEMLENFIFAP